MHLAADTPGTITRDQIDALLREAVGAVAGVNDHHPWSWHSDATTIELRADLPPVTDPWRRTLLVDGGAVLLNLRMLSRGLGVHPVVGLLPDPARRELVATVKFEGQRPVTDQDRVLVAVMLAGPTKHVPTAGSAAGVTSRTLISAMRRAAKTEQAWLAAQPMSSIAAETNQSAEPSGTAMIIGTVLDGSSAQLQAGQAAQRVSLTAAVLGVPVKRERTLLCSDANRRAVRDLLGGGLWPQVLLHIDPDHSTASVA